VASIREAGSKSLQKIAKDFGPEWAKEHLVPKVLALARNSHYLYRMTMLLALSLLASIVSHDVLVSQMLPVILTSAKDKVCRQGFVNQASIPHCFISHVACTVTVEVRG
jgi:serine/threonine-protein phosphatase 2A regulatory subunit A